MTLNASLSSRGIINDVVKSEVLFIAEEGEKWQFSPRRGDEMNFSSSIAPSKDD